MKTKRVRTGPQPLAEEMLAPGTRLGRYRIIRHIGRGGMGAVYEAEDPAIERRVAMKLVPALSESGRQRLLSEAAALSRISHANVITLHDVGIEGERVYLALELVRGTTLRRWLSDAPRDWGEILTHFASAGRGLAKAHEEGLAHGDFKPSNVLVATDGRVLVSDFGLAQSMESETSRMTASSSTSTGTGSTARLSRVVGTPAYMAPELFRGATKGALSDQFAFCVGLYEGLFGRHPFGGGSWEEVARAISNGQLIPPPRDTMVPRHIRAAVMRGLAHRPSKRWPNMSTLLDVLTGPPPRALPRAVFAVGGVLVAGAATVALVPHHDTCLEDAGSLDGVWDEDVRGRVNRAFGASGSDVTGETRARLGRVLDAWSTRWTDARDELCRVKRAGMVSGTEADARMTCLQHAEHAMAAVTDVLQDADRQSARTAISAASELPAPEDCANAELRHVVVEEDDQAEPLLYDVERAQALSQMGQLFDAASLAESVIPRADEDELCEASVRARYVLGRVRGEQGKIAEAEDQLRAAVSIAEACERSDLEAEAALALASSATSRRGDTKEGRTWLERARTSGAGAGRAMRPGFDARLLVADARVTSAEGDYEGALAKLDQAKQALTGDRDPNPISEASIRASILEERGRNAIRLGRVEDARVAYAEALAVRTEGLGREHPRVAAALIGLANVAQLDGDPDSAAVRLEQALALLDAGYGPAHPTTAIVLNNLAAMEASRGDNRAAREYILRAVEVLRASGESKPEDLATMRINAAMLAVAAGDVETGVADASAAADAAEVQFGPDARVTGLAQLALASARDEADDLPMAEIAARRAVAIFEQRKDDAPLADARAQLAEILGKTEGHQTEVAELRTLAGLPEDAAEDELPHTTVVQ